MNFFCEHPIPWILHAFDHAHRMSLHLDAMIICFTSLDAPAPETLFACLFPSCYGWEWVAHVIFHLPCSLKACASLSSFTVGHLPPQPSIHHHHSPLSHISVPSSLLRRTRTGRNPMGSVCGHKNSPGPAELVMTSNEMRLSHELPRPLQWPQGTISHPQ